MRGTRISFLLLAITCVSFSFTLEAQDSKVKDVKSDSVKVVSVDKKDINMVSRPDTKPVESSLKEEVVTVQRIDSIPLLAEEEFTPNSKKAVLYSVFFPGLGQFYNRKYWKMPIIYGGFLGLTYAISWNGGKYKDYSNAYKDIVNGGNEWKNMLPGRDSQVLESQKSRYTSMFKNNRDKFRRNRDLAIICTVGVYVLCMIDAYVDAELYNFDISPDLSMYVMPTFSVPTSYSKGYIGLQCNIVF